jgi:hypothetical protein
MEDWVLTRHNLAELERTFGKGWVSTESARTRMNQLERILFNNGFVYRVATWHKDGKMEEKWLFRQKRIKNLRLVMDNTINKHMDVEYDECEITTAIGK